MKTRSLILLLFLVGCAAGDPVDPVSTADVTVAGETTSPEPTEPAPDYDSDEWYTHEGGPFTVPSGAERYYCFSDTLTEDIAVDEIVVQAEPVVHHVVFAETRTPDPDGFFECDVLFQNNWVPIFISGTGDASLKMPENSGHILEAGTQLTLQLHLLNATLDEVNTTIPIHLHKMEEAPAQPVEVVVFGHMDIALPPGETSDVTGTCSSDSDMTLFSAFPHMHLLAQSMVVETGPDPDNMVEIFRSEPYDFDNQALVPMELTIKEGDAVRVTCSYDNDLDEFVTFGESSTNEMCFFIGFATGADYQFAGCLGGDDGDDGTSSGFIPETCGQDPPNDLGLGSHCTEGGGECDDFGFICTEDIEEVAGAEVCIGLACTTSSDCGEGGVCCSIPAAEGLTLCLPPSCVLPFCEELP